MDSVGGSAGFLAPEILAGGRPTVATDLWGLAAAFFAALTGEPPSPFSAPKATRHPKVPAVLAPLLESLLSRDPVARPVDAVAVLRRLGSAPTAGSAELSFAGRRTVLDLVCRRRAGVLLLCGPEGIGRTRLLDEARRRLQLEGRLVAATHPPAEGGGPRAVLLPVLRALAALGRSEVRADRRRRGSGRRRDPRTARNGDRQRSCDRNQPSGRRALAPPALRPRTPWWTT